MGTQSREPDLPPGAIVTAVKPGLKLARSSSCATSASDLNDSKSSERICSRRRSSASSSTTPPCARQRRLVRHAAARARRAAQLADRVVTAPS
eukprot:1792067-Prymnesium_polylepis.1